VKAEFFDQSVGSHLNRFGDVLQLKADAFSQTLFDAADEWDAAMTNDTGVQDEKAKLLVIRSQGSVILGGAVLISG